MTNDCISEISGNRYQSCDNVNRLKKERNSHRYKIFYSVLYQWKKQRCNTRNILRMYLHKHRVISQSPKRIKLIDELFKDDND